MTFIFFIALIILAVSHVSLRGRVSELEAKIRSQAPSRTTTTPPAADHPAAARTDIAHQTNDFPPLVPPSQTPYPDLPQYTPVAISQSTDPFPTPPSPTEDQELFIISWFKEQTLIKIGAIIFFLGAAWFVSYAIDQNWISPLTRILLGLIGAVIICGIGHLRARVAVLQYQVLTVLGTGVLIGTIAASQFSFAAPIIPATLALMLMVGGIGYGAYVALITKSEWLAVAATVAGLISPLLIAVEEPDPLLLLTYLFCLSAGFLAAAFLTVWRYVGLVLAGGVSLYVMGLYGELSDLLIWLFVCLFSALFTASVTVHIARTPRPIIPDIITLAITVFLFLISAYQMAFSTTIALFIGALVAALIANWLRHQAASVDAISIYTLISVIFLFLGTSNAFSGTTLTIIFTLEALLILIGSCYVTTLRRSVYIAASTFVIPLFTALYDLQSSAWDDGIWHSGFFGMLVFLTALGGGIVWLIEQPALRTLAWIRHVAGTLAVLWFTYLYLASARLGETLPSLTENEGFVLFGGIVALMVTIYVGLRVPAAPWRIGILFAWVPLMMGGLGVVASRAWNGNELFHSAFAVSTTFLSILIGLTLFYTFLSRRLRLHDNDALSAYMVLWGTIGYTFFWLSAIWQVIYPDTIAVVAQYVSYLIVIYGVVHVMLLLRVRFAWTVGIIGLGIVPLLLSLESYGLDGWSQGVFSIDAVGVYASIVLVLTLAITMMNYRGRETEIPTIAALSRLLFWLSGIQSFILIWMMAHTVAMSSATAVTLALFIYTVCGLAAYSYGRMNGHSGIKRAGILLLASVVLRLALVDVWTMEVLWRIITFLGIGSLFIMTALLERGQKNTHTQ